MLCEENQIERIDCLPKRLERFYCQENLLKDYPVLPRNLRIYEGHSNPNPYQNFSLEEMFKLQDFRFNYFTYKMGPKLKKYIYSLIKKRKQELHEELFQVYYSPNLPFYKQEWEYLKPYCV